MDGFEMGGRVQGVENGVQENGTCIDVSSDWKNRIDYIPHINIHSHSYFVYQIPNITMYFRSAWVKAQLCNLPQNNKKRLLRTKIKQTVVQGRFRSKWRMVLVSSIQKIAVQDWAPFWMQSIMNLNMRVIIWWSSCWMSIPFVNRKLLIRRQQVFNPEPGWNQSSGSLSFPDIVHTEEMGFAFRNARINVGRFNVSWQDSYLCGSVCNM